MLIIAHRGASKACPENTISAFQEAVRLGSDGIEFDVRFTKDNIPVVMHDATVGRTTSGHGFVSMMRFDKVRELRICGYEHVPTLGEALTVIGHRAHAFVELKAPLRDEKYRAQRVAWEIKNRDLISNSTIISFSMRDLEAIASCNDWLPEKYRFKINIGYLNLGRKDALLNAKSIGARKSLTLHPRIDERFIEQMHGNGIEVIAWTVDSAGEALRLARIGVDGIITNRPDRIKEALEKGKA